VRADGALMHIGGPRRRTLLAPALYHANQVAPKAATQQARARHGLATGDTSRADQHWQHARDIYTGFGVPQAPQIHATPVPAPTPT
jgi:hypothetical protein